jgi:hypothetical protein
MSKKSKGSTWVKTGEATYKPASRNNTPAAPAEHQKQMTYYLQLVEEGRKRGVARNFSVEN